MDPMHYIRIRTPNGLSDMIINLSNVTIIAKEDGGVCFYTTDGKHTLMDNFDFEAFYTFLREEESNP